MMRRAGKWACPVTVGGKIAYDMSVGLGVHLVVKGLEWAWQASNVEVANAAESTALVKKPTPYDFVVDVQSVAALCADSSQAWSVWVVPKYFQHLNRKNPATNVQVSVVACLGYYSKGKSTVLNLVHSAYHNRHNAQGGSAPPLSLDVGAGVTTLGLSGKFVGNANIDECSVLFLDAAGRNAPAKQFHYVPKESDSAEDVFNHSKRAVSDMRAREHVTDRAAFHVCDVMLYVVDEVLNEDQRFLLNYIYESRSERGMKGKTVVVVHNLKRLTSPEILQARLAEAEEELRCLEKGSAKAANRKASSWYPEWLLSPQDRASNDDARERWEHVRTKPQLLKGLIESLKRELVDTTKCVLSQFEAFSCVPVHMTDVDRASYGSSFDYIKQSTWSTKCGETTTVYHAVLFNQATSVYHNYLVAKWISSSCFTKGDRLLTAYNAVSAIAGAVTAYREEVVMETPVEGPVAKQQPLDRVPMPTIDDPPYHMQQFLRMPLKPSSIHAKYIPREFELMSMPTMSSGELKLHHTRDKLSIIMEVPGMPEKGFSRKWIDGNVSQAHLDENGKPMSWLTWRLSRKESGLSKSTYKHLEVKGYLVGARTGVFIERFTLPPTAIITRDVTVQRGVFKMVIEDDVSTGFQPGDV